MQETVELLEKYADAKFEGLAEAGENKLEPIEITLRYPQIKRMLGCEIEASKCLAILEKLGFIILGKNEIAAFETMLRDTFETAMYRDKAIFLVSGLKTEQKAA